MNDDKQGWDKLAEQEIENQQRRNISKVGGGCWFLFQLIVGGGLILIAILGLLGWLGFDIF
jgi:hypothetical protein